MKPKDTIPIGEITREHGIRGDVVVTLYSGHEENFRLGIPFYVERAGEPLRQVKLENLRPFKTGYLVHFDFLTNPEDAKTWRKARLLIHRDDLIPAEEGEFYLHDLVGFVVLDTQGTRIGILEGMEGQGGIEFYKVKGEDEREILVPVNAEEWILEINQDKQTITMDLPEGLLDPELS